MTDAEGAKAPKGEGCLHAPVRIYISSLMTRAREAFLHAQNEPDEMGKRLIEHGAWCYFNAARGLEALLLLQLPSSDSPSAEKTSMNQPLS